MLILSQKPDDAITLHIPASPHPQTVRIVTVRGRDVRLGFEAEESVRIVREKQDRRAA